MLKSRPFVLIIPAAGSGNRMGKGYNKLLIDIEGKSVLWHTVQRFKNCPGLVEIILAIRPEDQVEMAALFMGEKIDFKIRMVYGGESRQTSVYEALKTVSDSIDRVWVHDGARPFLKVELLERLIKTQEESDAFVVAIPAKDTIKRVDKNAVIEETLDRNHLWQVQTPQIFDRALLLKAYEEAMKKGYQGTDDASLVEWLGSQVTVVEGDSLNIKITTPEDLIISEGIWRYLCE